MADTDGEPLDEVVHTGCPGHAARVIRSWKVPTSPGDDNQDLGDERNHQDLDDDPEVDEGDELR